MRALITSFAVLVLSGFAAASAQTNALHPAFEPVDGQMFVASGEVAPGGRLIAFAIRRRETGVLQNEVRRMGVFDSPLVLPAGTRVYRIQITRAISSGYGGAADLDHFDAWCGARPGRRAGDRAKGACVGRPYESNTGIVRRRWIGADLASNSSPYYPAQFDEMNWSVLRESQPIPIIEPTGEPLPVSLELVVTFRAWVEAHAQYDVSVSDGALASEYPTQRSRPGSDGAATISFAGVVLRLTPTSGGVTVEQVAPAGAPQ